MRLAASLIALVLTGCLAAEDAPATEELSAGALELDVLPTVSPLVATANASVEAPVWSAGDAWAIASHGDGEEERAFLVVTAASSDAYTVATTSTRMATWDAIFDVSYVGRIRAADLSGSQMGTPVRFFDFPLADGKTWTTPWDGTEVALTAEATAKGFAITGVRPDGSPHVAYDYVHELEWWSAIEFSEGYGFRVEKRLENWTGKVASATAKRVLERDTSLPALSPFADTFRVDEGQSAVMLVLMGGSPDGYARALRLVDPAGQPYATRSPDHELAPQAGGTFVTEQLPPIPGDWRIAAPAVHGPAGGFVLLVDEVAIEEKAFP